MQAKETNQIKVLNTAEFLKKVITEPDNFKSDDVLIKALNSQGGIAKYENEEKEITSCSLNTLKTASEVLLERGFLELNDLRLNAKSAIEAAIEGNKANKKTKIGLTHKVNELEAELDITTRSNFLLTTIISDLRSKLKQLAENDDSVEERKELYRRFNKEVQTKLDYTLNGEL
ncbi:TPA: hypothetical protein NGU80_003624 [Vibrio parahaemolyticus]|nr:hypothetical protein [Vibrio parahaemolyticus]HCG9871319.1 hypothetical protein [Vibrio parahaemolyticus]